MLKRGISEMNTLFKSGSVSPVELIQQTIEHINSKEMDRYNAFNVSIYSLILIF